MIFTRPLNVKRCSRILADANLSSGLYLIPLIGSYFSCDGLLYIHPFDFNPHLVMSSDLHGGPGPCFKLRSSSSINGSLFSLSVCASVCLSVCLSVTLFSLCSHNRINMKFSRVITNDRSDVHAKGQGQRSKFKVTEVRQNPI